MTKESRALQFATMITGEPLSARCSACHRVFIAIQRGTDRTDDLILKIKSEFNQHECGEEVRR